MVHQGWWRQWRTIRVTGPVSVLIPDIMNIVVRILPLLCGICAFTQARLDASWL